MCSRLPPDSMLRGHCEKKLCLLPTEQNSAPLALSDLNSVSDELNSPSRDRPTLPSDGKDQLPVGSS